MSYNIKSHSSNSLRSPFGLLLSGRASSCNNVLSNVPTARKPVGSKDLAGSKTEADSAKQQATNLRYSNGNLDRMSRRLMRNNTLPGCRRPCGRDSNNLNYRVFPLSSKRAE